jgi:hypothetical protein
MSRSRQSNVVIAMLAIGALAFGVLGFAGFSEEAANGLLFAAWSMALLALFMLALRLPLRGRGSRLSAWTATALVTIAAIAVTVAANVALYRHDVHFDVSREGRNTPPAQLTAIIDHLRSPLSLTYFYNSGDGNALVAKELVEVAARGHPLFAFRAIDLDKEPGLARDVGVHAYNTALFQAGSRRVVVENNADVARLAYAAMRVLQQRVETVCFVTGHGETYRSTPAHFHYSHVETLQGHDKPGAGDVLVGEPQDLDRLQLALTEIGYESRGIVPASMDAIPDDCAVVADIGPRTVFAAGETDLIVKYLMGGGRLLLIFDPVFPVAPDLAKNLLGAIGMTTEQAVVIDPLNHFRTDPDKVAIPYSSRDHRAIGADGVSAGAADTRRHAAGRSGGQHSRHEQPGQFHPPAHFRRRGACRHRTGRRRRRPRRAGACGGGRRRLAGRRSRQAFPHGARRHQQVRHQRVLSLCLERRARRCHVALARCRRDNADRSAADLQPVRDRAHEPADARRIHRPRSAAAALDTVVRRTGLVETALMPWTQPSTGQSLPKRSGALVPAALAAGLLIALVAVLVISGHTPEFRGLVQFTPNKGLIAAAAAEVTRIEMRSGHDSVALRREAGGWTIDGTGGPVALPSEIAAHVDLGLRFMHLTEPTREIPAKELSAANFAEFGLDPPASVVVLGASGGTVATASFGVLNPAGVAQYVRLAGAGTVYLMPRHVGTEWQLAGDMVRRLQGQAEHTATSSGASLLLPMSMAQVWAVEIVYAGKLTRFERDAAGSWFRHTGQHSHASAVNAHVADPAQAQLIGAALDAFDQTTVETRAAPAPAEAELTRFGLALPPIIVLLYSRDSSTPLARLELGTAADGFDRYARLAPKGDVVTIAEFEVNRLTALLKAVGAAS